MIRKTLLMCSLGLLAACAPQHERQPFIYGQGQPVYEEPGYGSRRMQSSRVIRQPRQEDPLNALDKASRSIDNIVRRAMRWDR
jgi:hypothetical protein